MQQLEFASREKSKIARAILKAKEEYDTFKAMPRTLAGFMNKKLESHGISYKSPQGWTTLIEQARKQVEWEDAMRAQFAKEMKNPQMGIPDEPVGVVPTSKDETTEVCSSCENRYATNQMTYDDDWSWLCQACHDSLIAEPLRPGSGARRGERR